MKYKVWVEIEACGDDDSDHYEPVSPFPVCVGEFDTIKEADNLVVRLTGQTSLE
jgi:hypothetical protein